MKREFLQELRVGDQPLPKEVVDAIMAENGRDIQIHRDQAAGWEEKYTKACQEHTAQLEAMRFDSRLEAAVVRAKGRNVKAISALLSLDQLRNTTEDKDLDDALEELKKEHGYLFGEEYRAPVFASGTGVSRTEMDGKPDSLAGALRERFGI